MIARFRSEPTEKLPENKYYLEVDITEAEMEEIKRGKYPSRRVLVYQINEKGKVVKDSGSLITVSVGLRI